MEYKGYILVSDDEADAVEFDNLFRMTAYDK